MKRDEKKFFCKLKEKTRFNLLEKRVLGDETNQG